MRELWTLLKAFNSSRSTGVPGTTRAGLDFPDQSPQERPCAGDRLLGVGVHREDRRQEVGGAGAGVSSKLLLHLGFVADDGHVRRPGRSLDVEHAAVARQAVEALEAPSRGPHRCVTVVGHGHRHARADMFETVGVGEKYSTIFAFPEVDIVICGFSANASVIGIKSKNPNIKKKKYFMIFQMLNYNIESGTFKFCDFSNFHISCTIL